MTFLLQKHDAINRTQVRKSLRSFASGVAITGRLATACLLFAGFLGVGSAMAQTKILRLGGGPVKVALPDAGGVHHYLMGDQTAPLTNQNNPSGAQSDGSGASSFLVGGLALVTFDATIDTLIVSPIATGKFKLALSPDPTAALTTEAGSANIGMPVEFEVMSANAPRISGFADDAKYNQDVENDADTRDLIPRDMPMDAKPLDLTMVFSDPDNIFITYDAVVDMVSKTDSDVYTALADDAKAAPRRDKVEKGGETIASATIANNMLTVSLTDDAKEHDQTDIWVFARAGGEYARKRITIEVGEPKNPYVQDKMELDNQELREDGENVTISLSAGFADPTFPTDGTAAVGRTTGTDATDLTYEVKFSDASASTVDKLSEATGAGEFVWVTSYMTATLTITDSNAENVGHEGGASLVIDPRAKGSGTFTVTATDKGLACPTTHTASRLNTTADPNAWVDATVGAPTDPATHCRLTSSGTEVGATPAPVTIPLYNDAKSISDEFTVNIITKTTPKKAEPIPAQEMTADVPDRVMVNLADLNGDKDGEPKAFTVAAGGGALTYEVKAAEAKTDPKVAVMASVEGSVISLAPVWRAGDVTVEVTVTATNALMETNTAKFDVTVKSATKPIVNPVAAAALEQGFMIERGKSLTVDLSNVTGLPEKDAAKHIGVFIDPDASDDDKENIGSGLGLQLSMGVKDVVADHRYDDLSKENDVYTSAGRITLDPRTAVLTVVGTAPNSMTVTVNGQDRGGDTVKATTTITVTAVTSAEGEELPTEVSLSQNYPNPFNPQTTIEYALPEAGDVSLVVYDMLGREVTTLLDGPQAAGRHAVRFDGGGMPNGTYVYRLVAPNKTIVRTMVLVK